MGPAGEPQSCGACGQWWVPGEDPETTRVGPHELEIQNVHGDAIRGPFDRLDLRERLYLGILTGDELVRPVGGRFLPMRSIPDFRAVLELKERGKPRPVVSRKAAPAPPPAPEPAPPSTPVSEVAAVLNELEVPDRSRLTTIVILTFGIGLFVLVVAYLAYSMTV